MANNSEEEGYAEVRGDLFSSKDSLVHCVSADLAMGKGIALKFKEKFGQVEYLKSQRKVVGEVAVLKVTPPFRCIFYLVTKPWYYAKPSYETLRQCLHELKKLCTTHSITRLAMPRIGCGLDQLQWPMVRSIIQGVFNGTGINITVYCL